MTKSHNTRELPYAHGPVTLHGVEIGSFRIYEDGTLRLSCPTNAMGKELFERIRVGLTSSMSIVPDSTPAIRAAASILKSETVETPRTRSWHDFRSSGLLWLINRVVFHPRGRAVALAYNDKDECIGWQLLGDGTTVWSFHHEEEKTLFVAAERTLRVDKKPEEKEGI